MYSLARELHRPDSPVARFLHERLPRACTVAIELGRELLSLPTLRPAATARQIPYATIGTAIDYRLRYYFRETIIQNMDAFAGARWMACGSTGTGLGDSVPVPLYGAKLAAQIPTEASIPSLSRDFFDSLYELVSSIHTTRRILKPTDELRLSRYCFVLALFDEGTRNPNWRASDSLLHSLRPGAQLADLLALADDEWINDIGRMGWLFGRRHSALFRSNVKVNLRLNYGNFGASADLLVDASVVDIKARLEPAIDPIWLHQVVAYLLLDFEDSRKFQGIGFYLARQGVLLRRSTAQILPQLTGSATNDLGHLREDFRAVLGALPR